MTVRFRIQSTPNPNARKYILNMDVKSEGKVSYTTTAECAHVPLAYQLVALPSVVQVHMFENVITVSQDGSMDWPRLDSAVQETIEDMIETHDPGFPEQNGASASNRTFDYSPELKEIDSILERTIRPALQNDGGDVEPVAYENNILTVNYLGACGDCPSSLYGTLEAIKSVLRSEYDEEIEVVVV